MAVRKGPSRRGPLVLLAVGAALVGVAGLRAASELRDQPATGGATAPAGEACVGAPCRANGDASPARGYEAPSVAVDPGNAAHQVVGDVNLVGGRCGWHVTFDAGRTWADGAFQLPDGLHPCSLDSAGFLPMGNVAMGAGGDRVYAVLASRREDQGEGTWLATSSDGGRSFAPAREVVPGGSPDLAYVRPQLTVAGRAGGADRLYVTVWGCGPGRCSQGYLARSDDGGATFSAPVLVTPDPGGNSPSAAAVAPDGTVYLTFVRRYDDRDHELLLSRSTDGGATFASSAIDEQPAIGVQYDSAKVAVDPRSGAVYAVWADQRDFRPEVFFRRSTDGGRTWDKAVRLHTTPGGRAYSPAMAVAPDGRIEVVFYNELRRNTFDVHATFSTDGGATFAPDATLNAATIDRSIGYWREVGDDALPAVAATPSGAVFAWSDTANGDAVTNTQEILVRRVDRPAGA